jgi:hypothetical protein
MKTKRELRQEAIERLKEHINHPGYYRTLIKAIVGDDYDELTVEECDERLIDLLTDDDSLTEDDYLALLKDAARDYQTNVELWHGVASEQTKYINRETMTFPRDADGKAIRIGDELCGYGYPNGGVRCKAIVNERTILAGTDDAPYRDWLMWDAWSCRHYHKPTVEDVLREFVIALDKRMHLSNGVATTIAEYAPKLQVKEAE